MKSVLWFYFQNSSVITKMDLSIVAIRYDLKKTNPFLVQLKKIV